MIIGLIYVQIAHIVAYPQRIIYGIIPASTNQWPATTRRFACLLAREVYRKSSLTSVFSALLVRTDVCKESL